MEQGQEQVEHQQERHRFVLHLGGGEALMTYRLVPGAMVLDHTEVPPEFQHRGYADQLARAAIDYAREQGLKIDPQCRFMDVYMKRHPEVQDLLRDPVQG
jgi:predicted GNAT family acetyltransferase